MISRRRVFLKVLAAGPLVGCAGADPESPSPGGVGGEPLASGGSPSTSGGSPLTGGGSPLTSGGGPSTSGGSPFFNNGNPNGGNPFASSGSASGGSTLGGSTSAAGAATGTAGTSGTTSSLTPAGNVRDIAVGGLVVAAGIFLLGRDAKGLYVMSMQCTHKGCALVFSGSQLDCPCHHSRFDGNGNVLVGPATTPLPHFALFVDAAGNITVDQYTVVSGSARTAV